MWELCRTNRHSAESLIQDIDWGRLRYGMYWIYQQSPHHSQDAMYVLDRLQAIQWFAVNQLGVDEVEVFGPTMDEVGECDLCHNKGWVFCYNVDLSRWTVERCDLCNIFQSDEAAGDQARKEMSDGWTKDDMQAVSPCGDRRGGLHS